jgi:pantoate--beta-alanine ligase
MLEVVASLAQWRERTDALRHAGAAPGITMTMGSLHAGHVSLFERARDDGTAALASIFVNPLQFNDPSDLVAYPRDLERDLSIAEAAGVTCVLVPALEEVWPSWPQQTATTVHVAGVAEGFEGAARPGHFDGVASVVTKLLIATGPCVAYFGEKDYQQLCVVRRLVEDLALPARVVGGPIVRDRDGLALSSRNVRLSAAGRTAALALPRALAAGRAELESSGDLDATEAVLRTVAASESALHLAYAAVVEPGTLRAPAGVVPGEELRLLIAGCVEGVRLLDNCGARVPTGS